MTQTYILGGYTRRINTGIHKIKFDASKGEFTTPELIDELNGPTFVCLNKNKNLLFAINQDDDKNAGIVAYKKDLANKWIEVDRCNGSEVSGCHISFREESQTIYVANYHQGQIDVYQLLSDELTHIQQVKHNGSSIHPNQQSAHVHFTGFNKDESLLFACDLGSDTVSTYSVDSTGQLTLKSELKVEPGTGPRHLVISKNEKYVYINGELNNTTIVAKLSDYGDLTVTQTINNIPEEKIEESAGAAIRLSNDERFLYVSTRFYNVITVFEVNHEDGSLTHIQTMDTMGQIPRDFILSDDDNYLLIAHQDSDHISVFTRCSKTGKIKFHNNDTRAPECVCIQRA